MNETTARYFISPPRTCGSGMHVHKDKINRDRKHFLTSHVFVFYSQKTYLLVLPEAMLS